MRAQNIFVTALLLLSSFKAYSNYEDFPFVEEYESIYTTIARVASQVDINAAFQEGLLPFFFYQKCAAVMSISESGASKDEWIVSDGFHAIAIRHKVKYLSDKDENTSDLDYQSKVNEQISKNIIFFGAEYMKDLRSNFDNNNLGNKENITVDDFATELFTDDLGFCLGFQETIEADGLDLSKRSTFYD